MTSDGNNKKVNTQLEATEKPQRRRNPKVLEFNGVYKKYGRQRAVQGCNFTIKKGEVLAVISPEGQGKSTIAKLACGLTSPTKGRVSVNGKKAGRNTNAIVSYQPEIPFFKDEYTVAEYLNIYSSFFDNFNYKKAYSLLRHLDISPKTRFENLTTTALFIVQVILVASRKTSLYIFDDPLVHCDPKYRGDIITMIDRCRKNGAVLLLSQTSQGLDDITDKVIFLKKGSVIKKFDNADSYEEEFGNKPLNVAYKEVFKRA